MILKGSEMFQTMNWGGPIDQVASAMSVPHQMEQVTKQHVDATWESSGN